MTYDFVAYIVIILLILFAIYSVFKRVDPGVAYWLDAAVRACDGRDYDTAEECFIRLSRIRPKINDPEEQSAVEFVVEHGLGICHFLRNQFEIAEDHLIRATNVLERGFEKERRIVAGLWANLAVVYSLRGKSAECQDALAQLKHTCDAVVDSEILEIAESLTADAYAAAHHNLYELAFEIARFAESLLERTNAWQNGAMVQIQIAIASFHMRHCAFGAARESIEMALKKAGNELDLRDADQAYSQLGWIGILSGNAEEAICWFERSLELRRKEVGPDHWDTAMTLSALADAYRVKGDYRRAKGYSDESWEIQTRELARNDATRSGTATNRSILLIDLGEFEDADQLLANAARVTEGSPEPTELAWIRMVQGISAIYKGHHHRAEALLRGARCLAEEKYGVGHPMTCDYLAIHGASLIQLGHCDEAETILNQALDIRESLTDGSVFDLADLLNILAELYLGTNRIAEAESSVLRAQELIEDSVDDTHLIRADIHELLGRLRHAQSNFENAIEHFREALVVRDEVQPADHPKRAPLLEAYARTLESIGETALAEERRTEAEQIRNRYQEAE